MEKKKVTVFLSEEESNLPLGKKISVIRAMQHITQQELAVSTGISQPNISRIESGRYNPTVKSLEKIAKGLGRQLVIDFK